MLFRADALLFDIDGTLVDSTPAVERCWRVLAAELGLDVAPVLAACHGRRAQDTVAEFVPLSQRPAALARLAELELTDLDGVVALPGAAAILGRLPADRWAAVTSGDRNLMEKRLAAAGLPVPEVLIAAEDVAVGKPDPEGYAKAAVELGAVPQRCLVLEDTPAGVLAGIAMGAQVVAVTTTFEPDMLRAATVVVEDLRALDFKVGDAELQVTVEEATVEDVTVEEVAVEDVAVEEVTAEDVTVEEVTAEDVATEDGSRSGNRAG